MSDSNEGKVIQKTELRHPMEPPPKQGRGCFFYGCLTALVLAAILALVVFFTFRMIWSSIDGYLDEEPVNFPQRTVSEAEYNEISGRLSNFFTGLETPGDPEPLILTDKDINAYLAYHPELTELNNSVHFSIENSQIKGTLSLPLDDMGMSGRFLNGQGVFDLSLENDVLDLRIVSLTVRGHSLPEVFMSEIRKENFASEFLKDPEFRQVLENLDRIEVKGNQIILTPAKYQ